MSDNLRVWNKVKTPPKEYLKTIRGGRLSGKTDINPQWRWLALTEVFGPIGDGWAFEVTDRQTVQGPDGEVACFVRVNLSYRMPDGVTWADGVYGEGGAMLVAKEKDGLRLDDEAWKKATTDALGNAAKYLGVAADIFAGLWDGSKYTGSLTSVSTASEPVKKPETADVYASFSDMISRAGNSGVIDKLGIQINVAKERKLLSDDEITKLRTMAKERLAKLSKKEASNNE